MRLMCAGLFAAALAASTVAGPARADSPWDQGRSWMVMRAGYARSNATGAAAGNVGYGFGYQYRIPTYTIWRYALIRNFGLQLDVHHDILGRFGDATESEIPITASIVRHFSLRPSFRPYFGLGGGAYYRKVARTGEDFSVARPGFLIDVGLNTPLDARQVMGVDWRVAWIDGDNPTNNPVFGPGQGSASRWTLKLQYALTY